ncbi:MAG: LysR family transcriptional regulator [Acutalibacter sp.]|jgi:DNA-binding transcriptional LysR family regulator
MNLDYLRYFVCLAQVRHYTRAAQQLCISQPSLSHAIRQLEEELGVPLFEKTGRNTTLTRFGEEFFASVSSSLETLDRGVASLARSARGEGLVRLGFLRLLGNRWVPRLAGEFLQEHQGKEIRFTFHTGRTQELLEDLRRDRCDVVFCSPPPAGEGDLVATPVLAQEMVLIVPKGHPLTGRGAVGLEEAASWPLVAFSPSSGLRDVVDGLFREAGAAPTIACETEEDQVVAGLVAQGFGIGVLPRMEFLDQMDLEVLSLPPTARRREICLVRRRSVTLAPVAENFCRFVLDRVLMRQETPPKTSE